MSAPVEQLKEILKAHAFIKEYPLSGFIECACGNRVGHYSGQLDHVVDAILAADWQAPELPKPFDADCKACGLERQQAIEAAGQGFHHIRPYSCPDCGNKRCPKASDHRHACTGSNEPNQVPHLDS